MASPNYIQNLLDAMDAAEEAHGDDIAFRMLKRMIGERSELRTHLQRFDVNVNPRRASPGAQAAVRSAAESAREKEEVAPPEGSQQAIHEVEARPVENQPKSFEEASNEAHKKFLEHVKGPS